MSSGQFDAVYKKARQEARRPRPHLVNPAPKLQSGTYARRGTIRIKSQKGLGLGSFLLAIATLVGIVVTVNGIELGWLGLEIPGSIRMTTTASVATDSRAWQAMLEAQNDGDEATLSRLRQEGRVFTLAAGRTVRLSGIGLTGIRVRAIDGRDAGRAGWAPFGSVGIW